MYLSLALKVLKPLSHLLTLFLKIITNSLSLVQTSRTVFRELTSSQIRRMTPFLGFVLQSQAEFASSVVDFLHRVGRTGRAGQTGMVTNFYTEANLPLVEAVKNALTEKQTVVRKLP